MPFCGLVAVGMKINIAFSIFAFSFFFFFYQFPGFNMGYEEISMLGKTDVKITFQEYCSSNKTNTTTTTTTNTTTTTTKDIEKGFIP